MMRIRTKSAAADWRVKIFGSAPNNEHSGPVILTPRCLA
jgi:hypothetical protein